MKEAREVRGSPHHVLATRLRLWLKVERSGLRLGHVEYRQHTLDPHLEIFKAHGACVEGE